MNSATRSVIDTTVCPMLRHSTHCLACFITVALLLTLPVGNVASEHVGDEKKQTLELFFHQGQGTEFAQIINLSGTSNIPLRNTTWSVVNISGVTPTTLSTGPYLTSVVPESEGVYRWSLVVDLKGAQCTCYVEIEVEDPVHRHQASSLVVYVGDAHHRPVFVDEHQYHESMDSSPNRLLLGGEHVLAMELVVQSASVGGGQVLATVCEAPDDVCLDEPISNIVQHSYDDGVLLVHLNSTVLNIGEGIWRLDLRFTDGLLRSSGTVRYSLVHDNTPPVVDISHENTVSERESIHIYADVGDGYDGSSVTSTWAIVFENGSVRAPSASEVISDLHLVFQFSEAGHYGVELTVRDLAGHVVQQTINFTVENIRPTSIISVDGLVASPEVAVRLGPNTNWTLSGNQSMDNEDVDYLWVIDDERSLRGTPFLQHADFPSPGIHRVELIVFDDNGATHSSVVLVDILVESAEKTSSAQLYIGSSLILFFLVGALVVFQRSRSGRDSATLPRWQVPAASSHDGFDAGEAEQDATVEEEKARG